MAVKKLFPILFHDGKGGGKIKKKKIQHLIVYSGMVYSRRGD